MITIVYCTRTENKAHTEHLRKSAGNDKSLEIIEIINQGESLTSAYNRGLAQAKYDVVVFLHDDIIVKTNNWAPKLLKTFKNNPEYGIIGVAGSRDLPVSGRWWEDSKKMVGRVEHSQEGKTWLSSYSSDQGNDVVETLILDGVFFAIDKNKIKKTFDESVEGFHFYDVDFTFSNHLAGVKLGVITNIRILHKSIGLTNEEWEKNRLAFSIKFEDELPITLKRTIRKHERLKVLIGCLNFNGFTGSELHIFELAKGLIEEGMDVSVCSSIGEPLLSIAHRAGIKMYDKQEPPSYKRGDGRSSVINESTGQPEVTKEGVLYKINNQTFDIIHMNHKPMTEYLLKLYPNTDSVATIHSEVISLEEPVLAPQIKEYIAIRPEIKQYIVDEFHVPENKVSVIYNPIDTSRFNTAKRKVRNSKRVIFVGTIDYLRKETIQDLINTTRESGNELWIVGKKNDTYLDDMLVGQDHVKYFPPTYGVENLMKECDETAGILLGRTTIEGWLCGLKGWIYDVDSTGKILSKALHDIPEDMTKFNRKDVVKEIIEIYKKAIS